MKDEIKEILEALRDSIDDTGTNKINFINWVNKIEDCITNLQEENENLKDFNNKLQATKDRLDKYDRENTMLIEDYKSRCKKIELENEKLKEANVYCNRTDCIGRIKDSRKYDSVYQEKEDYKSRIEKVIEYNYELQERYCHSALFDELVASKIYEISEKQLNILQGGGKDD